VTCCWRRWWRATAGCASGWLRCWWRWRRTGMRWRLSCCAMRAKSSRGRRLEMSKHTAAPWTAERRYTTIPDEDMQVMANNGRTHIAAVDFSTDPKHTTFIHDVEEMRANARLIAASPL